MMSTSSVYVCEKPLIERLTSVIVPRQSGDDAVRGVGDSVPRIGDRDRPTAAARSRRRWWRRRWRWRWRRRRRRWWRWPRRRDLVVEDVLLAGAVDQDPAVRPRRVHGAVDRRVRAVVVARVAGLRVRVGLQRLGEDDVRDRGRGLPGDPVVGRQSPEALQVVVGGVPLVVPAGEDVAFRRHPQRGLPLAARAAVPVDPQRCRPGGAVVGRADVVDVALVRARTVLGVDVVDAVVGPGVDVAPAHVPPVGGIHGGEVAAGRDDPGRGRSGRSWTRSR